ncbi:MAG: glycosyltransferase family 4 protein [Alphaproteobacteria bacterium]|nr:glycosyltransferase family 4 protein [Alphaproteobacteria bacterium]
MRSAIPHTKQPVILQVLPEMRAGGVERGTVEIADAIVKTGWKAIVVSAGGAMVHHLKHVGATHIELPVQTKNPLKMRSNAQSLERIIKEHKVDIVHARSRAPAWSAYWACQKTDARFVTTFHGTYNFDNKWKHRYNEIMTKGMSVIAISGFIQEHILANYEVDKSRLRLIHRGVDMEKFTHDRITGMRVAELAKSWHMPEDIHMPVILCPGRITRWKGQHVLLEALAKIKDQPFFCVLLGDDAGHPTYRHELENKIIKSGLAGKVRITPNTNSMAEAYMLSSVVVAPSIEPEAFGRISIEAQAMGRPIIATNHGGFCETVMDGETGWLLEPGNVNALAAKLREVLAMPQEARDAWGEKSRYYAEQNFSADLMKRKTIEVYSELLWPHEYAQEAAQEQEHA